MSVKITSVASNAQPVALESYSIISKRARHTRRIEITAPSNQGAFYALNRLEQMGVDGQLGRDFQLHEAPALARRGLIERPNKYWSHRDRLETLRMLGRLRMNRFYSSGGVDWRAPFTDRESDKLRELLRVADENFVHFVYFVEADASLASAGEQDFSRLEQRLKQLAGLGVKSFVVSPASPEVVNRLRDGLRAAKQDVDVLAWPASLTKPAVVCLEPQFALSALSVDDSIGLVVSPAVQREASMVGLAVIAEYAWDAGKFDAPRAFDLAMKRFFDERSRAGLRVWASTLGNCGNDGKTDSVELDAGLSKLQMTELQSALEAITGTRERGLLRGELAKLIRSG